VFYEADAIPGWRGSLLLVTLKEQDLRRLTSVDGAFGAVANEDILLDGRFGRLRSIAVGPDGALYLGTSNRDGRGSPGTDDDRILRITAR
jgi:glucose/arabinose dehydrogenase